MNQPEPPQKIVPSGFFALRTPLLPFDELLAWSEGLQAHAALTDPGSLPGAFEEDRRLLRSRLCSSLERLEVREAIFVASPDLYDSLQAWQQDPEGERGQRVERALVRYFARMAGRPTPFGLFAGCSVGQVGEDTRLLLEGREKYERHTRLDMDYLSTLTEALGKVPALREHLTYRPNSSLYTAAGRVRYAEARLSKKVRSYHLVAAESTGYLEATLERAHQGARLAELAEALAREVEGVSIEEARQYVTELVDSQILVPDLAPAVTGAEPIHGLVEDLRQHPAAAEAAECLDLTRRELEMLDAFGLGNEPSRYRELAVKLHALPAKVELPRLFQVDMRKPSPQASLGGEVLQEIVRGVEILHRLVWRGRLDPFSRFREAFQARYEGREVPLVEALDEEIGIGFQRSGEAGAEATPLLEDLALTAPEEEESPWVLRHSLLLKRLEAAIRAGASEIVLEEEDLKKLASGEPPPLPDAFAVSATLVASSAEAVARGEFRVLLEGTHGPSGARLLGRFCHIDPLLGEHVVRHLEAERDFTPGAILAEVVHLPEGRLGNVICRPVLREYEIPFLGRSGALPDRQIPITDLRVSVRDERVVLRSARLGKEVIPRLTSAHNYSWRSLGVYRFLCALQGDGVAQGIGWSWGPLQAATYLPRVCSGRLVLARARWLVEKEELKELGKEHGAARFAAVQRWRERRRIPRMVELADGDNLLPLDLHNALSVESFVELVKDRPQVQLEEMLAGPGELIVRGPEGCFAHELVIPFVRQRETKALTLPDRMPAAAIPRRTFPPGSEWLYVKLYTGTATADIVLRELVHPLVRQALLSGAVERWFFIRYGDPDWHVRVRMKGRPQRLQAEVLPAMHAAAAPLLERGLLWRVQIDTYEREVERYGGGQGVDLAERIFQADSEAVLAIVELLWGDEGSDARWRLALRGFDLLLSDLDLDLSRRRALTARLRAATGKQFRAGKPLAIQLGDKFRKERRALQNLLDRARDGDSPLAPGLEALSQRSLALAPVMQELREAGKSGELSVPIEDLASSYVHMHANRMLRSAQNAQELVLYDFLDRLYESQLARAGPSDENQPVELPSPEPGP